MFVVSAYAGMTDLLLENKKSGAPGVYGRFVADDDADGWREAMEEVRGAMHKRNAAMFARPESRDEADAFVDTRIATVAACLEIGRAHSERQSLMRISYAVFCLK